MKTVITLESRDSIEVKLNKMHQTSIFIEGVEIYIEDLKVAMELLEALENELLPEEQHRSTLQNKIEGLEEKIADMEVELDQKSNDNGVLLQ